MSKVRHNEVQKQPKATQKNGAEKGGQRRQSESRVPRNPHASLLDVEPAGGVSRGGLMGQ